MENYKKILSKFNNHIQIDNLSVFLDDENDYTFLPIKRPGLIKYYYEQRNVHWVPSDIDMRADRNDFDIRCDDNTRTFVKGILSFFVFADGLVCENITENFQKDTSFWKEAKAFYAEQNSMEVIHGEMYSLMAEILIRDRKELYNIFNAIKQSPAAGKIYSFMKKYMDSSYSLLERIVAFACVEGILFNSAFASVIGLKRKIY
jgi:ribonucleoside-diphosphate reductase subunit M2